jgi:hypothetical protein
MTSPTGNAGGRRYAANEVILQLACVREESGRRKDVIANYDVLVNLFNYEGRSTTQHHRSE